MRRYLPLFALAILGLASPAAADVTARYGGTGKYAPTLSIAVDAAGQVHAEAGPPNQASSERMMLITRAGIPYFVASDAQGRFVGRQDDMIAIASDLIARNFAAERRRSQMPDFNAIRLEISERGMETVAGRQGRIYLVTPILPPGMLPQPAAAAAGQENGAAGGQPNDSEAAPTPAGPPRPQPFEIVISEDPELAPVGREMTRLLVSTNRLVETALGTLPPALGQLQQLLARGTVLRIADQVRLRSVSAEPIAQAAFVLPGPVLTRAQLAARAPQPPAPPPQRPRLPRPQPR